MNEVLTTCPWAASPYKHAYVQGLDTGSKGRFKEETLNHRLELGWRDHTRLTNRNREETGTFDGLRMMTVGGGCIGRAVVRTETS